MVRRTLRATDAPGGTRGECRKLGVWTCWAMTDWIGLQEAGRSEATREQETGKDGVYESLPSPAHPYDKLSS